MRRKVEGIEVDVPALHPEPAAPADVARRKASPLGMILIMVPILILAVCLGEKAGMHRAAASGARGHDLRAADCAAC